MNLAKLNPWNWFKDEDQSRSANAQIPVVRNSSELPMMPATSGNSFLQLHREMERMFDDIFHSFGFSNRMSSTPGLRPFGELFNYNSRPSIDIAGDSHSYQISLDVPGLKADEISIELNDDSLVISGEKHEQIENKEKQFYRMERAYGSFQRRLNLPNDANRDDITAKLEDGVLKLEIPRTEVTKDQVKRIAINA